VKRNATVAARGVSKLTGAKDRSAPALPLKPTSQDRLLQENHMATRTAANQLAKKLQEFHSTLPAAEQKALEELLEAFGQSASRAKAPTGAGLVAAPAGGEKAVADVKKALPVLAGKPAAAAITPTWTLTTITTTIASHPWITCKATLTTKVTK
jgi:hypothetical protein